MITMQLPSSIRYLPRRAHVFSTAAVVYILLKLTSIANRLFGRDDESRDDAWATANTRAAKTILRTANARRGLWIKCCQYVAARSDALPPEYSQVLSKSLDDCPPTPARRVVKIINEQLAQTQVGREWKRRHGQEVVITDLFDDFDSANPIASASIAQVHTAQLKESGRRVVLKVQHPGIRPMLLQDLEDLKTLLTWIAGAEPKFDMRPVLDAWIRMVPRETDFLNEMANLTAVKNTLTDAPSHLVANAYVPEPLPELTSDKLFVMEYIDGCKVTDKKVLNKHNVDTTRIVTDITRSFGNQLFVSKVFSGDPHPGNFLVNKLDQGGAPVLLDFGICVNVEEKTRIGFAKLILAAIDNDSYTLVQALGDVGVKLNRADPVASLDIIKYLFRTTASNEESRKQQNEFRKNLESREEEIERNEKDTAVNDVFTTEPVEEERQGGKKKRRETRSPIDSFPGDLVFFFRSLGMLRGLATALEVRHSYLDTLKPFAEHALLSSCPEEEALKETVYRPIHTKGMKAGVAAKALKRIFDKLKEKDMMIGMQVAAYRNGELVLNMASGQMGRYDRRPVQTDTVFNSFSSTKGLSAILFASLQDEYKVEYDDLVTKYWPEYGAQGKEKTTIGHLMSHMAGLPYALPEDMPMTRLRDDWQGIVKHLEQSKPSFEPGSKSEYHALTFGWLVAGLITKITGQTYQEHLRTFARTLGIQDECYCGTMPEELLPDKPGGRVAALSSSIFQDLQEGPLSKAIKQSMVKRDASADKEVKVSSSRPRKRNVEDAVSKAGDIEKQTNKVLEDLNLPGAGIARAPAYILDLNFFNHPVLRSGFVPSANGHFTARALAKIYAAVANDGVVEKTRVLEPGRAEKMQTKFCDIDFRGKRAWGAGVTLYDVVDKNGKTIPNGAVGHGGIGGSFAFAVPSERFSIAVTLNKLNALSISAAVVIAAVCKSFGVPMPTWYHMFAERAMQAFKEGSRDDLQDETSVMEKMLQGDGDTDIMKLLVG